jgi:hypothetical protein
MRVLRALAIFGFVLTSFVALVPLASAGVCEGTNPNDGQCEVRVDYGFTDPHSNGQAFCADVLIDPPVRGAYEYEAACGPIIPNICIEPCPTLNTRVPTVLTLET